MKQWKRVLGIVLAWCALSSVCAMGAESTVEKRDQESWKGTETKLMASHIAVDTTVTKYGVSWYQPKEYVSYRIWVDNTTNNSMRVTPLRTHRGGSEHFLFQPMETNRMLAMV